MLEDDCVVGNNSSSDKSSIFRKIFEHDVINCSKKNDKITLTENCLNLTFRILMSSLTIPDDIID